MFDSACTYGRNLADNQGPNPNSYAGENAGGRTVNYFSRKNEYGNVYADRRHRWITTAIFELPFGHGKRFAGSASGVENSVSAAGRSVTSSWWNRVPGWRLTITLAAIHRGQVRASLATGSRWAWGAEQRGPEARATWHGHPGHAGDVQTLQAPASARPAGTGW